jgi:hypothetical protein
LARYRMRRGRTPVGRDARIVAPGGCMYNCVLICPFVTGRASENIPTYEDLESLHWINRVKRSL